MAADSDKIATDKRPGAAPVISVEDVTREAERIAERGPSKEDIARLAGRDPFVKIENLQSGYGKMEILHKFNMNVSRRK